MRPPTADRVRAFDWLRGLAVLVMIQTHALSLLRPELRAGPFFVTLQWIDGLVAPAFILAAGFSLSLVQVRAALAKDTPGARGRRFRKSLRRVGEVLAVATLTNWMWFPIFREPKWILRVDILQCIGLSLLLALPLFSWLAPRPRALRAAALLLAALVFGIAPHAEQVTGPLALFVNGSSGAVFPLLPWSGYVWLGAAVGASAAIDGKRGAALWLLGLAAVGLAIWFATPWFSAAYPPHQFWVTNPANAARRWTQVAGVSLLLLAIERLTTGRPAPAAAPQSPATATATANAAPALLAPSSGARAIAPLRFLLETFGTSSLAGYFLHEMLLYYRIFGFSFHRTWGERCDWNQYWLVLALLLAATFALVLVVDRLYRRADAWLTGAR